MKKFWHFAGQMLQYRLLLGVAAGGAVFDAMCAAGGFAFLGWVIDQLFNHDQTTRQLLLEQLSDPRVQHWVGDLTWLAMYVPAERFSGFVALLALILGLAVVGTVGRFIHQYYAITVSLRTVTRIRKAVFQRMVHMPMVVLGEQGTADNLSRLVRDCGTLSRGFNALTSKTIRNILQGSAMLIVAVFVNWQLTLVFILGLPAIGILLILFGRVMRKATRRAMRQYGIMVGALQESMQALRVVKVHEAEGYERRRFNRVNRSVLTEEMRARTARALSTPLVELVGLVCVMVVASIAAWLVFENGQETADLFKVLLLLGASGAQLKPLANLNNDLQEAAAAAERIDEVLHLPVETNARGTSQHDYQRLPIHHESVSFQNVSFTYGRSHQPALRQVNLHVPHGQVCAIVGGNGSGKSTLLGLLPRLYEPAEGRVLIDGIDIASCSLRSIRRQMAVVTQDTILFDGTIAENITYGCGHVGRDRMIEAAKRSFAHEFIVDLPDGYDTALGEWGSRLSGGQRQRIAIARAILRDPTILILDEATSQIDADSEAKIAAALARFMVDRTTFVIAHRLSTVVGADMIVVMEAGCIIATGRHSELLESCPAYRALCQTQLVTLEA